MDWSEVNISSDYSGIVEEVGSNVTNDLKPGDRVAGFCHGGNEVNHEDGAFGEHITAKGDLQIKIPENLSFEEAATLGVGITTLVLPSTCVLEHEANQITSVGQGLYQSLQLPLPTEPSTKPTPLLIYGGSTATGSLAIQYAKLSGCEVFTTCSPRNFDYVKSLGADHVFDYSSPTCAQDIKEASKNTIGHAFDCISEGSSPKITVAAISDAGGVYSTLLPVPENEVRQINPKVQYKSTLGYTILGESFKFGPNEMPAKSEDFEFGKNFWKMSRGLLEKGAIKPHRPSVNKYGAGLEGILKGMEAMKEGKVSGEKLVYTF